MKKVTITIDPHGTANVEVTGVNDGSCLKLTEELEKALSGGDPAKVSRKLKPEAAIPARTNQTLGLKV